MAGWWNWNCRSDALAGRLKLIAPVVMKIKDPFILDNYFVWFINTTARDKLVYDSVRFQPLDRTKDGPEFFKIDFRNPDESDLWTLYTQRFGLYAPEFSCGHVRDMAKYIANMAWEMEHGVKPPFLDEKAAAVEYILRRDTIRPARALRREGERSYSFQDQDDGKRKTVYVATGLEDVPPGFQAEGAVQINEFYVSCPETEEETPAIPAKSAKAAQKQKRGRTMHDKEMSVRQWQELYWAGTLREDDLAAQELADQDDFADPLNDRRLKSLCKLALAIAHPFILDNYRVFFSEGEPNVGPCYGSVGFYPLDKNRFQNLFLSYDIFSCKTETPKKDARGFTRRSKSGRIMLYVPKEKWVKRLMSYGALKIHYDVHNGNKEVWEPVHRNHLIHLDDLEILKQYNAEIRGLYNYYKIANNVSVLNDFNYVMKFSMFKTFGAKYKAHIGEIRDKYRIGKEFGVKYQTKKGWKTLLFYNEGFRHVKTTATGNFDAVPNQYFRTSANSLITRLKAKKCEWCGAEDVDLEIHHVRKLKNLKGKAAWERAMIGRKRKTMALCVSCHDLLHAGKLD